MLSNILKRVGIGFLLGMSIGNFIALVFSYTSTGTATMVSDAFMLKMGSEPLAYFIQTLLCGVIGIAGVGGMSFYEIEHWSMLKTALVHYLLCIGVFIPTALFLDWLSTAADIMFMVAIEAAAYFIIWLVFYISYRVQISRINVAFKSHSMLNYSGSTTQQ